MPRLASNKYCTGCLACVDSCKLDAIDIKYLNGLSYVKVNPDKCVECGLCEKACSIINPLFKNSFTDMRIYGGWCKLDEYRIKGASGGAFAALALSFFSLYDKVCVVGANLEKNRVRHILIESIQEIELLMNSKYIQSYTRGIYREVLCKLKAGYHVLFSGTPCQIAGLYGFLGKKIFDTLYTVEVVCHGIAGYEALDLHLEYYHSNKIYSFREKSDGQYWYASQRTTININNRPIKIERNQDIFYRIFSSWLLDRKSCSNCVYSSFNRVADITLADFWGGPFDECEYQKGVSLIIGNNQHGDDLIKQSDLLYVKKCSLEQAINSNPNLYTGYKFIQYHPLVMFPKIFKKLLPPSLRLSILSNRMPWKCLWGGYKVLTKLHQKTKKRRIELLIKEYKNEKNRNYNYCKSK